MKNRFALSVLLVFIAGIGLAFATPMEKAPDAQAPDVKREDAKTREFKDILFKLVRQDEYLDEALETLDPGKGRMRAHDISAMGLSLKLIAGNLNRVSARNRAEFAAAQPGSGDSKYTGAIFSYSRKVNRKVGRLSALVNRMAARKAAMRDAVSSRKGGKKARGRKLTQLLEEQKALETLAADAKNLRAASRGLNATSKWLYIASK